MQVYVQIIVFAICRIQTCNEVGGSQGLQVDRYAACAEHENSHCFAAAKVQTVMQDLATMCKRVVRSTSDPALLGLGLLTVSNSKSDDVRQISECHRCRNAARLQSCSTGRGQS